MFVSYFRILLTAIFFGTLSANATDTNCSPKLNNQHIITIDADDRRHSQVLTAGSYSLQVTNLLQGQAYDLFVNQSFTEAFCSTNLIPLHEHEVLLKNENVIRFKAKNITAAFNLQLDQCIDEIVVTFSIGCLDCPVQNPPSTLSMTNIMTDNLYTPIALIEDVFIGGDCFQVEQGSIDFTGGDQSRGYFSNGTSSIDLEEGVILSTGDIAGASGPNIAYNTGSSVTGLSTDPDLAILVNNIFTGLYDITALEFDFTPTSDMVTFDFVFASEEYCEYVGSNFNDVFGFFISGPGINGPYSNGAENIAALPNGTPIQINSVNYIDNAPFYNNNIPAAHFNVMPLSCSNHPTNVDGIAINDLEYDGFTVPITATSQVIPCETYHIKLIIADVGDAYFDSAVFLKANSFNAGGSATVTPDVPGFEINNITEDCNQGFFVFQRTIDDLTEPLTINYTISNSSTATPGVDYEPLPSTITIPAGDSVFILPVNVFDDNLVEGNESIILELEAPCSCDLPFTSIEIQDSEPFSVFGSMDTLCQSEAAILAPEVFGGLGGYTYLWSTSDTTASINVTPEFSTEYSVTVTDACGHTAIAYTQVEVVAQPTAFISGYSQVCAENPQGIVQFDFEGSGPWTIGYNINNVPQGMITNLTDNPFLMPVSTIGVYHLTSVQTGSCQGTVIGAASVEEVNVELSAVISPVSCPNQIDGSIDVTPSGGVEPYTFIWNTGDITEDLNNQNEGFYQVTISDALGCTTASDFNIELEAGVPQADAGTIGILTCDITQLQLNGSGSQGSAYTYFWTTIDGVIDFGVNTLNPQISQPGTYTLHITNINTGCAVTDAIVVDANVEDPQPDITIQGVSVLTCQENSTILNAGNSQPVGNLLFQWSTQDGLIPPGSETMVNPQISTPGTYELLITNQVNGCTQTETVFIDEDIELPEAIIEQPAILNCSETELQLNATASSIGNEFVYTWSTINGNIISGANTLIPQINQPGLYTFHVYNQQTGCENQANIVVDQDVDQPVAVIDQNSANLDCNNASIILDGNNSSVGNEFKYEWSTNGGNIVSGHFTLNPVIDQGGIYQLLVTNQNNGCTQLAETSILEDFEIPDPAIEVIGALELNCIHAYTILDASSFSAPFGILDFKWSTSDGNLNGNQINEPNPQIDTPGTYVLTVTNQVNGCTNQTDITITLDDEVPVVAFNSPAMLTCIELTTTIDATASSSGPEFNYNWTTLNGNIVNGNNSLLPMVDKAGTYTLTIVNENNGCDNADNVLVAQDIVPPVADAGVVNEMLDCNTPSLSLNGTGSSVGNRFVHFWTTNDGQIISGENELFPEVNAGGTYTIMVTNTINGCTANDAVAVLENTNFPYDANLAINPPLCFGEGGSFEVLEVLGGEGPYLFAIDNADNFYTDSAYVNMEPGIHSVLIQDMNGCEYTATFQIPDVIALDVEMDDLIEIKLGESHEIEARINVPDSQIDTIIWTPTTGLSCTDCLNPVAFPLDDILYTITIVNKNGCVNSEQVLIKVQKDRNVYIPNAFSPNDDGENDVFMIFTNEISIKHVNQLQVFNRWGEKLYEATNFPPNDKNFGWTGYLNGQKMNPGVFVYFAQVEFIDGVKIMFKGDVSLLH